jgi:hypothetical protein
MPQSEPEPVFAPQPEEDLNRFEATLEKKPSAPERPKRDRFDEDMDATKKKPSFVPVLVTFVILIVLGAGGYYAYTTYSQKTPLIPSKAPSSIPETTMPQVPVPAPEPTATNPVDTMTIEKPSKEKASAESPIVDANAAAVKAAAMREAAAVKAAAAREAAAAKATAAKAAAVKAAAAREAAAKIAADRAAAIKEAGLRAAAAKAAAAKAVEPPPVSRPSTIEVFDEPAPAPAPVARPAVSTPPPALEPEPTPAEPEPAPAETAVPESGEPATVFLASIPPLADVYMDGKVIGKSNSILTVATGTHTLRFVKGDKEITKQFTFTPGKNSPSFIKIP